MAEINQFGSVRPAAAPDAKACAQFESMLADAVDGVLSPEEQRIFDQHARSCADCGTMLAEAQRGAAWMEMLKAHPPEPSATLVQRILAETSVRTAVEQEALRSERRAQVERSSLLGAPLPSLAAHALGADAGGAVVLPFRSRIALTLRPLTQTVLQPRFMMTAAMAFFSIALTLNVSGIRLSQIRASDLRPASLRRDFYQANAHVVRYYDNLRVVYELESRVHDLQRSSDDNSPAQTYPAEPEKKTPESNGPDPKGPSNTSPSGGSGANGTHPGPRSDGRRRDMALAQVNLAAYHARKVGQNARFTAACWKSPEVARTEPRRVL